MTRIIGGVAGGHRLRTPAGSATRPTSDRVREALFSSLESDLGSLVGCRFLDLFAGSGAVGLEARSRGAAYVLLVEQDRATAALARANIAAVGLDSVDVVTRKVDRLVASAPATAPFDIVFLDPPYAHPSAGLAAVLHRLLRGGWCADDGRLVVERSAREAWSWPPGTAPMRERRYGETMLWHGRSIRGCKGAADA